MTNPKRKTYTVDVWGWEVHGPEERDPDYAGRHKVRATSLDHAYDLAYRAAERAFGGTFESSQSEIPKEFRA